ncbi:MAG: hypothetical protein QCH35_08450 [Methanomicrobiaceae archaeon]|nr:hypothetical protein [Methanomicrobiaceae archaeon]
MPPKGSRPDILGGVRTEASTQPPSSLRQQSAKAACTRSRHAEHRSEAEMRRVRASAMTINRGKNKGGVAKCRNPSLDSGFEHELCSCEASGGRPQRASKPDRTQKTGQGSFSRPEE